MSDTSLNKIIQYGTAAARAAFTPAPAAGSKVLYIWYDSDASPATWVWNGAAWVQINNFTASNALLDGSVHSDTIAQAVSRGSLVYGNATPKWDELTVGAASSVLTADGTDVAWDTTPAMAGIQVNGRIAPAQLVANTDDYNPANLHTTYELSISASGAINLTGLNAGVQGEQHVIVNDGTNTITLKHATTSLAANQFWCPGATDFSLSGKTSANLLYDNTAQKWLVSGGSSAAGTVTTTGTPASGNLTKFSGASSITNGDLAGDVTTSGTLTATIANSAVTLAKIANAAANSKLVGSGSAGAGAAYSEITLGSGLSMSGTTLSASATAGVQFVVISLTDAQIKSLNTTPVEVVAAQGAGKIIVPLELSTFKDTAAGAYSAIQSYRIRYNGNTTDLVSALSLTMTATDLRYQRSVEPATISLTTTTFDARNKSIRVDASADVTGGNAANTVKVAVAYYVFDTN